MEISFFTNRDIVSDEGRHYKLNYHLIVEDVSGNDGDLFFENYGISIRMDSEGMEEIIEAPNITVDQLRIQELLVLLSENSVTPTSAIDVIDDWLSY